MKVAFLSVVLAAVSILVPVAAQAVPQSYQMNIPRQRLDAALKDLAQQAGLQIARFSDTPGGDAIVGPVTGDMSVADALHALLTPNKLTYRFVNDHTIAVVALSSDSAAQGSSDGSVPTKSSAATNGDAKEGKKDSSGPQPTPNATVGEANQNASGAPAATDNSQAAPSGGLQEILITAEKRAATVQDTPISVTVVSGQEILDRGITDFSEIAEATPGVSMNTSGPGQTEFEMRGLTSSGGSSATVGFYLDDVPLTAPTFSSSGKVVIDPNLYDLNRVEILGGPQGTLYGSGSMGGTIKVVTNQPNLNAFDASAQVTPSGTDGGGFNHAENAMLNIPLIDGVLALRIVGSEAHTTGWINRVVIASGDFPLPTNGGYTRGDVLAAPVATVYKDVNDTRLVGTKLSVLWKPTDELTITPVFFWQETSQDGPNLFDSNPGTLTHYEPYDIAEPDSDRFSLSSLNVAYKFKYFDLNSTTAYWNRLQFGAEDFSEGNLWSFGLPSFYPPTGAGPGAVGTQSLYTSQTSEELRLTSSGDTDFKWLIGSIYTDFHSPFIFNSNVPGLLPLGITPLDHSEFDTKIRQIAGFGELSYRIIHGLTATAGLRWYSYQSPTNFILEGQASSDPTGANEYIHASASATGVSPKYNLAYEPNSDLMIYATVAKGFRPGGTNFPVPDGPTAIGQACLASLQSLGLNASPVSFAPDDVWSYEVGEKSRLFDGRVTLNGDVYLENWENVQQFVQLSCGFNFIDNAGKAQIYGSELEAKAILIPGLVLSTNVGYTHAQLTAGSAAAGTAPGDPLQDVPAWTTSTWLAYSTPISQDLKLTMRAENDFVGDRVAAGFYSRTPLPSYDLTNIRIGVTEDHWSAFLFVKNVFDKQAWLGINNNITVNTPDYNRITTNQPLTIGLDVNYRFGRARER